jgi:hypothetical protein
MVTGYNLPDSIDKEGIEHLKGFCSELRKTGKQIVEISQLKIVRNTLLFFLLQGLLNANFD